MSSTTITVRILKAGQPYDAGSVKFKSPATVSPAYGLKRTDTDAILIASGTDFTHTGTGLYQTTITDPAPGLVYNYWREMVIDGKTFSQNFSKANTGADPTCRYCEYQKFIKKFGVLNVAVVSNKDNTSKLPDTAAVQDAFDFAASEIDARFLGTMYISPLDFSPFGVQPPVVARWAMNIAYCDLYEARGWDEKNKADNKMIRMLRQTHADMSLYACGVKQLNARLAFDSTGKALEMGVDVVKTIDVTRKNGIYWMPDGTITWNTFYFSN